jgi:hypothetical protein
MGRASGGSATEGHADAHATEVVNQPFQTRGQARPEWRFRRRFGDLEIATDEVAELRRGAGN